MKKLLVVLGLTLLTFGCSRSNDEEGSGTRGGGGACEVDVHRQLTAAYDWIANTGIGFLEKSAADKVRAFSRESLQDVDVTCSTERIEIAGVRKTAYSEEISPGKFKMRVDENQWFASKAAARTGVAVHEIFVMLGVERTGYYKLSAYYGETFDLVSLVNDVECYRNDFNGGTLRLMVSQNTNISGSPWANESFAIALQVSRSAVTLFDAPLHNNLNCFFEDQNGLNFSCYRASQAGSTDVRLALETVNSADGLLLNIYWENFADSPLKHEDFVSKLEPEKEFLGLVDGPITTLRLSWNVLKPEQLKRGLTVCNFRRVL